MRKTVLLFVFAILSVPVRPQVGVADPGVYTAAAPVGPTPVEQWLMNEGSGQEFLTSSSSGDNLTGSNISWATVSGFPGSVPVFNGSSTSAVGANQTNTNFDGTTPFSVSLWATITAFSGAGGTFVSTLENGGNLTGWEVALNGNNSTADFFNMDLLNFAGSNGIQVLATTAPTLGVIHHFVATYDGSQHASGIALYIDGASQTVSVGEDNLTGLISNTQPVVVGERLATSSQFFDGSMADLRIYDVQLTSTQVSAIFAAGPQ
jgi:Concanavalin A-like lectin/glucanases superfamily